MESSCTCPGLTVKSFWRLLHKCHKAKAQCLSYGLWVSSGASIRCDTLVWLMEVLNWQLKWVTHSTRLVFHFNFDFNFNSTETCDDVTCQDPLQHCVHKDGGSPVCACRPGFIEATGGTCYNPDDCSSNAWQCKHGSTCVDSVDDFLCVCPWGYMGR